MGYWLAQDFGLNEARNDYCERTPPATPGSTHGETTETACLTPNEVTWTWDGTQ